jgi:GNAT superfamily N-acetyltransferase
MLHERIRVGTVGALDEYYAQELGCTVALLTQPGLHIVASQRRTRPGWGGFITPVYALATEQGGVISARPDQVDHYRRELAPSYAGGPLGPTELRQLGRLAQWLFPYAYAIHGDVLYCDPASFRGDVGRAERLWPDDRRGESLRRRFDGAIFVIWGERGEIASWAAIKRKSSAVWEIAVTTEPPYRGRGYARQVVSAATRHILDEGRLALYIHETSNRPSARVARAVGYQAYTEAFFCEY